MNEFAGRLHSRYQPQLEADRYINTLRPRRDIDYYILIEPGMGYLISSLRAYCPDSTVIVLHADKAFRETQSCYPDTQMWFPDSGTSVQVFLEQIIPERASARVIEWRPSLRLYGDKVLNLVRESTEFIKVAEASRRTGAAFGGRWVRNFFRNLTLLHQTLLYKPLDMPIVITGSGPSLESVLPEIRAVREGLFVLAASSSLPALAAGGITPDMVIGTDGGSWALLHLHACFYRGGASLTGPAFLACALSAALPSQCSRIPLLPINDGSLWQSMAMHSIGIPSVLVPQRGTVTASALELALILGSGSIFLAGMDLSVHGIQSHARPYGFDHLFYGTASRFRPMYLQYFVRSNEMKAGGSHDVYAAWFKTRVASWPKRVFSLVGNHAVFADNLPQSELKAGGSRAEYFKVITINGSPMDRCKRAAEKLISALGDSQYSAALSGELSPLLFPLQPDVPPEAIAEAIRGIAQRYTTAMAAGDACG